MKLYGREYGFRFSVGAALEMAKLCPNGKIENLTKLLDGANAQSMDAMCALAEQCSLAYEQAKAFETGAQPAQHMTREMALSLDFAQLGALMEEVMAAFYGDAKTTVAVEESKKKEAAAAEKSG